MTFAPEPQRITVRIKEACRITGIGRSKLYELGKLTANEVKAALAKPGTALSKQIRTR